MTTANTCSRLGTCSEEVSTIWAASGSGDSISGDWVSESSTAASDSEDLGRKWNVCEEEEREWLWEERERKVRLVLLEKESVGVDGFCFGEILQWVARDEHKESVTEAIVAICSPLSQSSQLCSSSFVSHSSLLYAGKQVYPIFLFLSVSPRMTHMPFKLHFSCYSYSIQTNIYKRFFLFFAKMSN